MNQEELRYIYDRAKARMESHPDHTKKCKDIIREYPRFDSEKEALEAYGEMERDNRMPQIWARVERDDEFFRIRDYYIVTDDVTVLTAAEYIGFAQIRS